MSIPSIFTANLRAYRVKVIRHFVTIEVFLAVSAYKNAEAPRENKEALQENKEAPQEFLEAPQHILEAPETQGKRTWAEISADANQGNTVANSVGDVGDGDVVTLRPQMS